MGSTNKLLLPFRGSTLIEHVADKLLLLDALEIIVVTGHEAPRIHQLLRDRPFRFTYNPAYSNGMTTSIQQGVFNCHTESKGALICLSDMPYLELEDMQLVLDNATEAMTKDDKVIVAPTIAKRMGNPVFFSRYFFPQILAHQEANGCKSIIKQELDSLIKVPLNNNAAFNDIDTPADWKETTGNN